MSYCPATDFTCGFCYQAHFQQFRATLPINSLCVAFPNIVKCQPVECVHLAFKFRSMANVLSKEVESIVGDFTVEAQIHLILIHNVYDHENRSSGLQQTGSYALPS